MLRATTRARQDGAPRERRDLYERLYRLRQLRVRLRRLPEPCFAADRGYMSRAAFIMDRLLRRFGELAFLPAACTRTNETPVYLSDLGGRAEISAAILALQVKRLISVDFALPLQGFDYAGYEDYPVRGSMALTAAGQEALDSLNIQGCGE